MDLKLKLNINIKNQPFFVKAILAVLPAVIISVIAIVVLIVPQKKEIDKLKAEIIKQENEIARDQAKAAKLTVLMLENEKLKKRLSELKLQLPEEKEVSGLLKQVSDLGINSGLKIAFWRPAQKKDHPSGIIYEIPVAVEMAGSYHSLGMFFSNLTTLHRIVNISDIRIADPKPQRNEAVVKITFKATTFSAVPESEIAAKAAVAGSADKKDKGQ